MHVACVLIDHLPFKLEMERDPGLRNRKAIIFHRQGSRRVVLDASPAAKTVLPGMSPQEAMARYKDAVPIEADGARYEQEFSRVVLRLGYRSPVVEAAAMGCAYVGLDGLQDTYGSEERLLELLLQAVPSYLGSRIGVSEGKFTAYLAALSAQPGRAYKAPHNIRDFVAPWSIDMLPIEWAIKVRLHGFGLNTLGQVAKRPIGPIQSQFGKVGARLWLLSQGIDDTPLIPHRVEEELLESASRHQVFDLEVRGTQEQLESLLAEVSEVVSHTILSIEGDFVKARVKLSQDVPDQIAAKVVGAGLGLRALGPQTSDLESIFVELTGRKAA